MRIIVGVVLHLLLYIEEAIAMNCPKCKVKMKSVTRKGTGSVRIATQNPGRGGDFGDSPHEYGSSGFGDLYEDVPVVREYSVCPSCGYEERA
jgi:hypothetical protein